ncbi:putative reverse transcriptase, RNA-dependent DNA polymerase [Tanacetum coccineum]|uniref:Reverse transcriptase, RNA-dependent DNA polymerase n=1 Tax=Tanacetum coccineum TaxID=301880 RepID=A0ABQ5BME9_9ASTR
MDSFCPTPWAEAVNTACYVLKEDVPNVSLMDDNTRIFAGAYDDEDVGGQANLNNLETTMNIEAMQEELLQFELQKVWKLVDLPNGKRAIGTKWVFKNKKDERGIVVRTRQDWLHKMDVKSALLYGTIKEEVHVFQPPGFEDPHFPDKVYKITSTLIETNKALVKDEEAEAVDVHLYRLMIGSFMYLTTSRPDTTFAVCACARFQVTPKVSHLHAMKRIFRYLKGQPKLGIQYPRYSSFDLEAFYDSDYAGASLDRKSTIGEYVVATNCCGQVLWIQDQMLDYGFNFMNTKIYIDNESTICIVKNIMFYSKTKHIKIKHHFIRDSYEKKLIKVIKIHTDHNVADLLTKAFDVSRFNFLVASSEVLFEGRIIKIG